MSLWSRIELEYSKNSVDDRINFLEMGNPQPSSYLKRYLLKIIIMKESKIYKITCIINKKIYIGQTIQTLNKRFKQHIKEAINNEGGCTALNNAIRKYDPKNFTIELLKICCDEESLDKWEKKFIKSFNTISPNGYNIRSGGVDGKHNDESRERMRQAKLGNKNPNFGKSRSLETRKKISLANSGANHVFYGNVLNDAHKENSARGHRKDGFDLPMYIIKLKARPEKYCDEGYAVMNHPILKTKYFTSKKLSMDEKLSMALEYLFK